MKPLQGKLLPPKHAVSTNIPGTIGFESMPSAEIASYKPITNPPKLPTTRFSPAIGACPIRPFSLSRPAGGVGFLIAGCATLLRKAVTVREARCILNSVLQEKLVPSNEERIVKFLKPLPERKSALRVPQSLSSLAPEESPRIPGGNPASLSTVNKRWELVPHSEAARWALLPDAAEAELASYQKHIESCIRAVRISVPSIMVGTVGGGKWLATQSACLAILGLARSGQPRALSEVCRALAPAGKVSLTSAILADVFARVAGKLARGRDAGQKADNG